MKSETCEMVREYLLAAGWDAEQRRQAARMLQHAEGCEACRSALGDFDRIRDALAPAEACEPAGGWEAMQWRMDDTLRSAGRAGPAAARPPVLRPSLAIAASIAVIAAATFEMGQSVARRAAIAEAKGKEVIMVERSSGDPAPATISPNELSHDVEAFRQVADVYDGRAGWMMVSQNDSDVGIMHSQSAPSNKVLLLRLDLWHGRELVSNSDLLVLAGQTADLTVPMDDGQSLHYRIGTSLPADDDYTPAGQAQLHLWLELNTPRGHSPLAALSTNLQLRPDQKVTAGKLATSAGEYELKIEFKEAQLAEKSQ
jgi:hypothetical protein